MSLCHVFKALLKSKFYYKKIKMDNYLLNKGIWVLVEGLGTGSRGFSIILVVGTSLVRREFFTQLLRTAPGALRTKLRNTLHHRLPYRTGTVFILACYSIPFVVVLSLVIDLEYFSSQRKLCQMFKQIDMKL